jgi:hypothetical protein
MARHHGWVITGIRNLLDQRTDTLGLLQRVFHYLLQVSTVFTGLLELVAVFLDFTDVDQQGRQRSVELAYDVRARPIDRLCPDIEAITTLAFGRRDVLDRFGKLRIADPFSAL